ncbi:superoxide dismutase [Alphaproteobacteria bacterium]|nr:superoxide dismutase [Alphaproteobacteria bacterium]
MTDFALPELPYAAGALEPVISARTLDFHWGKHHRAYVANLNGALKGSGLEGETLENIIAKSAGKPELTAVFNNAAQAWNHAFFWQCLAPNGGDAAFEASGAAAAEITRAFGSLAAFKEQFAAAAVGQFGSGWAWLVRNPDGALAIAKTANADNPLAHGAKPLFTLDVWEHAYYLDYQNRRVDFAKAVLDRLANWAFVAKRLSGEA